MDELKTAKQICQKIESSGYDVFFVGGAVRDMLMGLEPNDIDIATNMPMKKLEEQFQTFDIGKSKDFGIVVVVENGFQFEIAQFRGDGAYTDGRRPDEVVFLPTFEKDAARRDFTINALAMKADGTVLDFFGGQVDINLNVLRTVGNPDDRFHEDFLRILRLARFAAKLDFSIDRKTKLSARKLSRNVSFLAKERITDELRKASKLGGKKFAKYIKVLDELKVLQVILPEVHALKFKPETPKNHPEGSTTFKHTMKALESTDAKGSVLIATLFHDLGKAVTYEVGKCAGQHTYYGHDKAGVGIVRELGLRLKFSSHEIKMMAFCCENHMRFHRIPEMKKSKVVELVQHGNFQELSVVCLADSLNRRGCDEPLKKAEQIMEQHKETKTCSLVDGKLVMELLNLKPGKEVGRVKNLVSEMVVDNDITDQETIKKLIVEVGNPKRR